MGGEGKGGNGEGRKYLVDQLLDAVAQLVVVVAAQRVVDGREGRVDAIRRGRAHVVDQVGQVVGRLQLDAPVGVGVHGRVHGGSCGVVRRSRSFVAGGLLFCRGCLLGGWQVWLDQLHVEFAS